MFLVYTLAILLVLVVLDIFVLCTDFVITAISAFFGVIITLILCVSIFDSRDVAYEFAASRESVVEICEAVDKVHAAQYDSTTQYIDTVNMQQSTNLSQAVINCAEAKAEFNKTRKQYELLLNDPVADWAGFNFFRPESIILSVEPLK